MRDWNLCEIQSLDLCRETVGQFDFPACVVGKYLSTLFAFHFPPTIGIENILSSALHTSAREELTLRPWYTDSFFSYQNSTPLIAQSLAFGAVCLAG